jgi:hypothetical protein
MELTLNISKLKRKQLTPDQFVLLFLLYHKNFEDIKEIYGISRAIEIRNSLLDSGYLLNSDSSSKFTETLISKKSVEKLLEIRSDSINFFEFYNLYPIRVGSRVLRAAGGDSQLAKKHEKKYLDRVKSIDNHKLAIRSLEAFVNNQRRANKMQFMPNMETVLNNSMWESWQVFIQPEGNEEQEWNTQTI